MLKASRPSATPHSAASHFHHLQDLNLATSAAFVSKPKLGLPLGGKRQPATAASPLCRAWADPSGLALQLYSQMSARGDGGKAMLLGSGFRASCLLH